MIFTGFQLTTSYFLKMSGSEPDCRFFVVFLPHVAGVVWLGLGVPRRIVGVADVTHGLLSAEEDVLRATVVCMYVV